MAHPFICAMTHLHVIWLIHMWHNSQACVIWLFFFFFFPHITTGHEDFRRIKGIVMAPPFICAMTHLHVIWLIHMWHHSQACVTCEWVMSHMNEGAMTSLVFHPFQLLMASNNVERENRLIHMWHHSLACVIWLFFFTLPLAMRSWEGWKARLVMAPPFIYAMTHLHVIWLIHMWYNSQACVIWLFFSFFPPTLPLAMRTWEG